MTKPIIVVYAQLVSFIPICGQITLLFLGLQQIFDSFGYSLEFWYSNSKINIQYSFTYAIEMYIWK